MAESNMEDAMLGMVTDPCRLKLETEVAAGAGHGDATVESCTDMSETTKQERQGDFQLGDNIFDRWWRIGTAKGLMTDAQIASFLLDQYDNAWHGVQSLSCCVRCHAPLTMMCARCDFPTHCAPRPGDDIPESIVDGGQTRGRVVGKRGQTMCSQIGQRKSLRSMVKKDEGLWRAGVCPDLCLPEPDSDAELNSIQVSFQDASIPDNDQEPNLMHGPTNSPDVTFHTSDRKLSPTHKQTRILGDRSCHTLATMRGEAKVRKRRQRGTGHVPIVCSECPASFTRRSDLEKHMRKHTGERPFVCKECGASYTQNNNLKFHIQSQHTGERPWVCDECGAACIRKCDLKVHMQKHSGLRPYVCEQCNTAFTQKGALRVHMRIHTNDRPYLCKECGAAFRQEGNLQRHMRTHTGERPFKCSKCNASFAENGTLKIHMRKHTGDRPYVCEDCGAAFTARGALNIHRRTHTGDRPYVCEECGAAFTHNGALKRHERTHTGDKPHVCSQCGTAFAESYALKNHIRKIHKPKTEPENVLPQHEDIVNVMTPL